MKGTNQTLLKELQWEGVKCYVKYFRMDDDRFQIMVSKVSHFITKQSTHLQNPISMEGHLMFTLEFLDNTTAWRVLRLWMEERPLIWRVAANKLNKQSWTADKGWSSSLGVG